MLCGLLTRQIEGIGRASDVEHVRARCWSLRGVWGGGMPGCIAGADPEATCDRESDLTTQNLARTRVPLALLLSPPVLLCNDALRLCLHV